SPRSSEQSFRTCRHSCLTHRAANSLVHAELHRRRTNGDRRGRAYGRREPLADPDEARAATGPARYRGRRCDRRHHDMERLHHHCRIRARHRETDAAGRSGEPGVRRRRHFVVLHHGVRADCLAARNSHVPAGSEMVHRRTYRRRREGVGKPCNRTSQQRHLQEHEDRRLHMIIKQGGGACEYGDTETRPMHNEGTPRYDGPRELAQSLTAFARMSATDATWNREGLREDSEYRDLGLAAVTNGRIGAKHIRALKPLTHPTGWHWHDMTAHYLYVLRGSVTFRFAGVAGDVTLHAGDGLSHAAGRAHNTIYP